MHQVPITLLAIEPGGYHLMIQAFINGYKANVLIDTGASRTVMDIARVEHFNDKPEIKPFEKLFAGLGAGGIKTHICTIPKISFGTKALYALDIVCIDMTSINKTYAVYDLPRIDMVLGGDLLVKMNAVIDYRNLCMLIA